MKTTFAGGNPFAALEKKKREPQADKEVVRRVYDNPPTRIDVSNMRIADDPRLVSRGFQSSKYDQLFTKLKPGQCIVCDPKNMNPTRNALQKWLAVRYPGKYIVRGVSHYPTDGKARVWMLNKGDE